MLAPPRQTRAARLLGAAAKSGEIAAARGISLVWACMALRAECCECAWLRDRWIHRFCLNVSAVFLMVFVPMVSMFEMVHANEKDASGEWVVPVVIGIEIAFVHAMHVFSAKMWRQEEGSLLRTVASDLWRSAIELRWIFFWIVMAGLGIVALVLVLYVVGFLALELAPSTTARFLVIPKIVNRGSTTTLDLTDLSLEELLTRHGANGTALVFNTLISYSRPLLAAEAAFVRDNADVSQVFGAGFFAVFLTAIGLFTIVGVCFLCYEQAKTRLERLSRRYRAFVFESLAHKEMLPSDGPDELDNEVPP